MGSHISRLYEKSIQERRSLIQKHTALSDEDLDLLESHGLSAQNLADSMSENVIGTFPLPLGVATHFIINNRSYLIPFSTEEASVVAAASYGAKLSTGFTAHADEPIMSGMIQLMHVRDIQAAVHLIRENEADLLALADSVDPILIEHGGGAKSLSVQIVDTFRGPALIVHLYVHVSDAMGASCVITMCEKLAPRIVMLTGGQARMAIVNNFAVERRAVATAIWPHEKIGIETIDRILDVYALACADKGRACTHNKGIMNGIDAVVTATGNDVRAIEAGAHVWACRSGLYQPLTTFTVNEGHDLVGTIELPMAVGIVGGCTRAHPIACISLKMLKVQSARELAMVIASVGLAQNFAALRALVCEGIQYGHHRLHERKVKL